MAFIVSRCSKEQATPSLRAQAATTYGALVPVNNRRHTGAVLRLSGPASLRNVTSAAFAAMLLPVRRCAILVGVGFVLLSSSAFGAEPPDASSDPSEDPHVALGAGGHVALGIAPVVALGTRVSAEIATRRWSLGVEGRYDAPAGRTVRASLVGGSFVPCLRTRAAWACGVVLASRVTFDSASASDAWLLVGIGARFEKHFVLPFDFALRLSGEVLGHPIPYELTVQGRRVFLSSAVSILFGPTLIHAF